MIMSTTTKDEKHDIYRRFDGMIAGGGKEIKLCYVTVSNCTPDYVRAVRKLTRLHQPERLAKDKNFVSKLQKLYEAKKLSTVDLLDQSNPNMQY